MSEAKEERVALGCIIVGRMDAEGRYCPGDKQPPADESSDFHSVRRWLTREAMTGEHVLVRAYRKKVKISEKREYTSSLT